MPDNPGSEYGPMVTVAGLLDEDAAHAPPGAAQALGEADVVVGGRRHLELWRRWCPGASAEVIEVGGDISSVVDRVATCQRGGQSVCVLASGDPGFFGILRSLLRLVDRRCLAVLPAPSSVSLAFARLGLPWDDAAVISVHGRPLTDAIAALRTTAKAAVLTSPEVPPETLGAALLDQGLSADLVAVCSNLGTNAESVVEVSLEELAKGSYAPLSVVVLVGPAGRSFVGWGYAPAPVAAPRPPRVLAWGLPEAAFRHRAGMITKAEVRSVVLGNLALPSAGVLWDLGAGSGSVAIEASLLQPGLVVFAVERTPEDAGRLATNASEFGAAVHVVVGEAPGATDDLPAPDRVFVGGGGLGVLQAALERLRPGGRLVATYSALDRAAAAATLLGNLVEVAFQRGERLPDGGWRLVGQNPVFVVWGPEHDR